MFNFKSWSLEMQASMERKFQMSSIPPCSSESSLLLSALESQILVFLLETSRLQQAPLSCITTFYSLRNHSHPCTDINNFSPPKKIKSHHQLHHFSSQCPFSLSLFWEKKQKTCVHLLSLILLLVSQTQSPLLAQVTSWKQSLSV